MSEEIYRKWTRRLAPRRGDVILTREAPLGDVGKIRSDDKVFLGQRLYHFRADPAKLDSDFLLYALLGDDLQGQIKSFGSGSTVAHMRLEDIPSLEFNVPPLAAQKRIASVLSAYDDLIENNERRIKILESMARALYREWFVHFRFPGHENHPRVQSTLGEIPEGWKVEALGDACQLTMGNSPKSEFYNEVGDGIPFHQGVSDFGARFPTDRLFCTVDGRMAEAGDILFSVRAPVGRMNIAGNRIVIGRGLSAIRHHANKQAFLWEQLRSRFTEVDMMGNGAIFAAVTKADMLNVQLLSPPESLVDHAERQLIPLHEEIAILTRSVSNLRRTRDLLLPRLLSGAIDLQEATP